MQYINGLDVSSQCITELLMIKDKLKMEKYFDQDGFSAYEIVSGMLCDFQLRSKQKNNLWFCV